jgi:DNA-directed RNA polymerase subunit E"
VEDWSCRTKAGGSKLKACRQCRFLIHDKKENRCTNCNSTDLSVDYSGIVIIVDPEKSEIAKRLNVSKPGQYALRVR